MVEGLEVEELVVEHWLSGKVEGLVLLLVGSQVPVDIGMELALVPVAAAVAVAVAVQGQVQVQWEDLLAAEQVVQ